MSLLENNYVVVENFIDPEYAKDLHRQLKAAIVETPWLFDLRDEQARGSPSVYNFLPFVDVLLDRMPAVSELFGRRVYPTYVYSRLYKNGAELVPHIDRPSCEVSVTLHLGSDGEPWPFFIRNPRGDAVRVDFKPGMGVVYLGTRAEHWRPKLGGDNYGQIFMHYVDATGPFKQCVFDRT